MKIDDSNREYSESEVRSYIKGLNARIANAETIHAEAQRIAESVIDELKKENAELKKYLSLAMHDIKRVSDDGCCFACTYNEGSTQNGDDCERFIKVCNCYEWQYKEQALKLIGEENEL